MAIRTVVSRNYVSRATLLSVGFPHLDEAGYPMISHFIGNEVFIEIPFWQRVGCLFTGRLVTRTTLQTDARVEHLRSVSHTWLLVPRWFEQLMKALSWR